MIGSPPQHSRPDVGERQPSAALQVQSTKPRASVSDSIAAPMSSDLLVLRDACDGRQIGWSQERQAELQQITAAVREPSVPQGECPRGNRGIDAASEATVLRDITSAPGSGPSRPTTDGIQQTTTAGVVSAVTPRHWHTAPAFVPRAARGRSDIRYGTPISAVVSDIPCVGVASEVTEGDGDRPKDSVADTGKNNGSHKLLIDVDSRVVQSNNRALKCIFDIVARDGRFNFRGARIPLPSGLNIRQWRSMLRGYWDYNIVEYLEFGWPIGIDRDALLVSEGRNHPSASAHPRDVEHYIATELGHSALLGPFAGPPANTCHYSPLMTRPKKDSKFRRVIIDLSWPRGCSVNDGISKTDYIDGPLTISLPTHDDMERAVVGAGRGSFLYKTDLSRGYRQLRVDPLDWPYLAFQHTSGHFMDICPPFGLRSSAMAMQRVSQAIVHLHGRRGYVSRAYIDDFGGVERTEPVAQGALATLQDVMRRLGVVQADNKICLPSQVMVWLGIRFDTVAMSMTIPKEKLGETMACLEEWRGKSRASRREMQSLLGLLNFVATVAPPARLFTNRMLDNLRETGPTGSTSLSCQFKQDVQFFLDLLPLFNGRKLTAKQLLPYQHQVELDACLTGCGAVAGEQFYATPFPEWVQEEGHTIAHLELLNIVVAVKVWGDRWSGWTVQIYCDNANSVFVLQTGRSRDLFMRGCAREIFLYTAAQDIDLQICHRPGVEMVWADALSREHTHPRYADFVRNDPHLCAAQRVIAPPRFFRINNTL